MADIWGTKGSTELVVFVSWNNPCFVGSIFIKRWPYPHLKCRQILAELHWDNGWFLLKITVTGAQPCFAEVLELWHKLPMICCRSSKPSPLNPIPKKWRKAETSWKRIVVLTMACWHLYIYIEYMRRVCDVYIYIIIYTCIHIYGLYGICGEPHHLIVRDQNWRTLLTPRHIPHPTNHTRNSSA